MLPIGVNDVNYKPDRNAVAESNTWLAVRAGNNKDGSGYKYGDDIDPTPYLADDEVTFGLERIGKVPNAKGGKSTKANRQAAGTNSKPSV